LLLIDFLILKAGIILILKMNFLLTIWILGCSFWEHGVSALLVLVNPALQRFGWRRRL